MKNRAFRTLRRWGCLLAAVLALVTPVLATPPPEDFYVDVRTYLPEGHVTDGSVDYKVQIQKCLDEHVAVFFSGSDDPDRPMVYGVTGASVGGILRTRPNARLRFGPNTVLRKLPSIGDLLTLGHGAHLIGAVIDGNKYAHWPLVKDREFRPYAFVIGHAVKLQGRNLVRDCFVYDNAGIAFGGWHSSDNKVYRSRAENCGFFEATPELQFLGEHASADGFFFARDSGYNLVKDCEAFDCTRWDFVPTENVRYSTFVDCRGGDVNVQSFGFIDVESAGPGNSLVRCKSPKRYANAAGIHLDVIGCTASEIVAEHASYPRILGCTVVDGPFRACEVGDDRFVMPGRESPMVLLNRIFLGGPSADHSLTVSCSDGRGTVADNVLYGFRKGKQQSTEMLLYGVASCNGNIEASGDWKRQIDQFQKGYYLRAHVDQKFVQKRKREVAQLELAAYLPKLGIRGKPAHQQILLGSSPSNWTWRTWARLRSGMILPIARRKFRRSGSGGTGGQTTSTAIWGPGGTSSRSPSPRSTKASRHFYTSVRWTVMRRYISMASFSAATMGTTPRAGPSRSTSICRSSSRPAGTTWRSGLRPARA